MPTLNDVNEALVRVYDASAHTYILALKRGEMPDIRPEFGKWERAVSTIERSYKKSHGSPEAVERCISALCKSDINLAELLAQSPTATLARESVVERVRELGIPELPESIRFSPERMYGASPTMERYVAFSKQLSPEGYEDFHPNGFLFLASTIAGRRICIPFSKPQYTPLMIVYTARTTLYVKTTTAEVASDVLAAADLDWMLGDDKTTPQALIADMARGFIPDNYGELPESEQKIVRQSIGMTAQRGWYYDEFGKFVKAMLRQNSTMADFAELLLTLDRCAPRYRNSTLKRGREVIEKPYLALLGSMTPANIRDVAKGGSEFWSDGFWARFAFVCPPQGTALDSPMGLGIIRVPSELTNPLKAWHDRLGLPQVEMEQGEDGKWSAARGELPETVVQFGDGVYEAWVDYRSALKHLVKGWHNEDLDGSYGRLPTKAIRVAALLASLENNNIIELRHWAMAQHIAERWRISLHELYAQVNTNGETHAVTVEDEILRHIDRLTTQGKIAPSANDLHAYMKTTSRAEIEERCQKLVKSGALKSTKTSHTTRYNLIQREETLE